MRRRWWALIVIALGVAVTVESVLLIRGGGSEPSATDTVHGSGVAATQARHVPPFQAVELAGSNNVTIRVGDRQSVLVHADSNLLGRVTTEVHGGKLVIGNTPGDMSSKSGMSVEVTVPSLKAVRLSGSGTIGADGVDSPAFAASLDGSGVVRSTGSAARVVVSLGGSGQVQLERLVAHDATATLGGSGELLVNATDTLNATLSGTGSIVYFGHPKVVSRITGTGAVLGSSF